MIRGVAVEKLPSPIRSSCQTCTTSPGRNTSALGSASGSCNHFSVTPDWSGTHEEIRRILILNEVGASYPGIRIINEGIQAALNDSPYRLEFYSEYMDYRVVSRSVRPAGVSRFLSSQISESKPHVIITVGPSALNLCKKCIKEHSPACRLFSACLLQEHRALPHWILILRASKIYGSGEDSRNSIAAPTRHRARG